MHILHIKYSILQKNITHTRQRVYLISKHGNISMHMSITAMIINLIE